MGKRKTPKSISDVGLKLDDVTPDTEHGDWTQLCAKHGKIAEGSKLGYLSPEGEGSGTCGVVGCDQEADYYFNFKTKKKTGGVVGDTWYQADYYDKVGGHGALKGFSEDFEAEYKKAMQLYRREKKSGELGKSTGYIGVSGSGDKFAILFVDKAYVDSIAEQFFKDKAAYEAWMKVAKNVLETGKPEKGNYGETMAAGGKVRNFSRDRMFLSQEKWEQAYKPFRKTKPKKYHHHYATGGGVEKPKPVSFTEDEKRKGLYTVLFSDGEKVIVDFTLADLEPQRNQADIFRTANRNYEVNNDKFKKGGEILKEQEFPAVGVVPSVKYTLEKHKGEDGKYFYPVFAKNEFNTSPLGQAATEQEAEVIYNERIALHSKPVERVEPEQHLAQGGEVSISEVGDYFLLFD